jgi:hypothetical protein
MRAPVTASWSAACHSGGTLPNAVSCFPMKRGKSAACIARSDSKKKAEYFSLRTTILLTELSWLTANACNLAIVMNFERETVFPYRETRICSKFGTNGCSNVSLTSMAIGAYVFFFIPQPKNGIMRKCRDVFLYGKIAVEQSKLKEEPEFGSPRWRNTASVLGFTPGRNPFHWEGIAWPNAATMKFKKVCEN